MRVLVSVLLVAVLAGCTSVKMVQRDGCWVRRTEKRGLGTVHEEVGPCARPATAFVENEPLTRMVQECVSRADYRWQMRALAAWDRREPWPEQLSESSVLQQCMDDAARGVLGEAAALKEKNAALEQRLATASQELEALKAHGDAERKELVKLREDERRAFLARSDEERKQLISLQAKLGEHLGDAAKKVQPMPPAPRAIATATSTSEGRSRTEGSRAAQAQPATLAVVTAPGAPAACMLPETSTSTAKAPAAKQSPARQARTPPPLREASKAAAAVKDLPACDPGKTPPAATASAAAPVTVKAAEKPADSTPTAAAPAAATAR